MWYPALNLSFMFIFARISTFPPVTDNLQSLQVKLYFLLNAQMWFDTSAVLLDLKRTTRTNAVWWHFRLGSTYSPLGSYELEFAGGRRMREALWVKSIKEFNVIFLFDLLSYLFWLCQSCRSGSWLTFCQHPTWIWHLRVKPNPMGHHLKWLNYWDSSTAIWCFFFFNWTWYDLIINPDIIHVCNAWTAAAAAL